ncbi:type I-F CRISPR-associated endoribonuclease Cas6/Csy4, partial [Xanthomonas nasturtii]
FEACVISIHEILGVGRGVQLPGVTSDAVAEQLSLPFVVLGSCSTGQASFPLFIRHGPLLSEPKNGSFNSYGLSQEATVPWF